MVLNYFVAFKVQIKISVLQESKTDTAFFSFPRRDWYSAKLANFVSPLPVLLSLGTASLDKNHEPIYLLEAPP